MIDVKIIKKRNPAAAGGRSGAPGTGFTADGTVKEAEHALRADLAGYASAAAHAAEADHAGEADHAVGADLAEMAKELTPDSPTRQDFLSRKHDDRSAGKVASDIGFEIGTYSAGVSGGMIGNDAETGQSYADLFKLYVRGRAYFETLTVVEAEAMGGKQYITPGGGIRCTKVEKLMLVGGAVYRCWFLSEQDGEKTECKFAVDDQAISEMFNARTGTANKVSNHRYWRLVTAVNNDAKTDEAGNHYGYIDLSVADCEADSDEPQAGDDIVQLGSRTDPARRAAMIHDTVGPDAPSVKLLTGIGAGETAAQWYSLDGKAIISEGYNPDNGQAFFKCFGRAYIGAPDGSSFVEYDPATKKMLIKADLEIGSTVDGKPVGDYVAGAVQEAVEERIALSQEVIGLACDADGNRPPGSLPPQVTVHIYKGTTEQTDWTITAQAAGCTATSMAQIGAPPSPATYNISALTADTATVDFTATKGDKTLTARCQLYKVRPGKDGQDGANGTNGADGADGADAVLYTLEASAQVVKRDYAGKATPAAVTCHKYRTEGAAGRTSTGDNILKAKVCHSTSSDTVQTVAPAGVPYGSVTITSDVTEVEFSLYSYDDNALLARVRVPVVSDMEDYYPASGNLIVNSALNNGARSWALNQGVTRSEEITLDGDAVFKISQSGLTANGFRGFLQSYRIIPDCRQLIVPEGVKYLCAAVCSYRAAGATACDQGARLSVEAYDSAGTQLGSQGVSVVPSSVGAWERHSLLWELPAGTHSVTLFCYVTRNGELYLGHPQLHWGNALPAWAASSYDFNYLTEAMRGSTAVSGGLVLSSLIQCGQTAADGTHTARSGMNGIVDPQGDGRDVAFWAGGTFDQARAGTSTYAVDMNGNIKAAKGTVEIGESAMTIHIRDTAGASKGDVVLDRKGLRLLDADGLERLQVTDQPLPASTELMATSRVALAWSGGSTLKISYRSVTDASGKETRTLLGSGTIQTQEVTVTERSELSAVLGMNYETFNSSASSCELAGSMLVQLVGPAGQVTQWTARFAKIHDRRYRAEFRLKRALEPGTYRLCAGIATISLPPSGTHSADGPTLTGQVIRGMRRQNMLTPDGFLAAWDDTVMCVCDGDTFMRCGNFGWRVQADGIYVLTDGTNWRKIDPTKLL